MKNVRSSKKWLTAIIIMANCFLVSSCSNQEDPTPLQTSKTLPATNGSGYLYGYTDDGAVVDNYFPQALVDNYEIEFSKMKSFWGVRQTIPLWYFSDLDPNGRYAKNAFSYPQGYIAVGRILYMESRNRIGVLGPIGILAHEFGHQLQFQFNFQAPSVYTLQADKSMFMELEADALATFYLNMGRGLSWLQTQPFFDIELYGIGDYALTADSHHGTPAQRRSAGRLGFQLANSLKGKIYTIPDIDALFRYYYIRVVAADLFAVLRTDNTKPQYLIDHPDVEQYMDAQLGELIKIFKGEISDESYKNLK